MKRKGTLSDRKLELVQWLLALENETMLSKIEALVCILVSEEHADGVIPELHLNSICKGDADSAADRVISLEEFRAKYARYGI
jgi:hypothetical protein